MSAKRLGDDTSDPKRPVGDPRRPLAFLMASGQFLDAALTGLLLQDALGAVIGFNDVAAALLGTTPEELATRAMDDPAWNAIRQDSSPFPADELPAALTLRTGQPTMNVIMGTENSYQARTWVLVNSAMVRLEDGDSGVLSSFVDVTGRVQSRRVLELVTEVNRIVVDAQNEDEFLNQLCQVIVDKGPYALVWIGVISMSERDGVDIAYAAGRTEYLYDGVESWWGSTSSGMGPTGIALRTRTAQVTADLATQARFEPWRERAAQFGLGALAAIPLTLGHRLAVMSVYDRNRYAFDETTVRGLEDVAREIEFGLAHLRSREETNAALDEATRANESLSVAEGSLAESEQRLLALLANSSDYIFVLDEHARIKYANPASERLMNIDGAPGLGQSALSIVHPDDYELAAAGFRERTQRSGSSRPIIYRVRSATGEWRFLEVVSTNCLHDPAINGVVVNARDVTERIYLERALQTLSRGNRILVRAMDEATLIADICQTIVESGAYPLAWVGYADHNAARTVRPVASAGRSEYLDGITVTWGDDDRGLGPTGTAIRHHAVQVLADVRKSNWPTDGIALAEEFGLRSMCAFPLAGGGDVIGALTIASDAPDAFGPEELELLGELAADLGMGIAWLRDAEQLARQESELRDAEIRFRLAFESNTAPMVFSDLEDKVIAVNPAFCELVGFTPEELVGFDSKVFTHPDDIGITEETLVRLNEDGVERVRYVKRYQRKDGKVVISEVTRSPARDASGRTLYYVASERDVTEERALADRLEHQALHDSVTGLANRTLFEDRLQQAAARLERFGGYGAVLLLDLDEFKAINDTHGHYVGDQLLLGIAQRFEMVTRSTDTLGRFGGDEFLYLAEGLNSPDEADEVAERLLAVLEEPFSFNGMHFVQRASIGIVIWDGSLDDASELIQRADVALYEAKHSGKGNFAVFNPSMQEKVSDQFTLVQELRHAMATRQMVMHYQPIVNLTTGEVDGFESLMRWRHPDRGWIAPAVFIPLAEQSGLMVELGAFALREALAEARSWPPTVKGGVSPYVTVNMSALQFRDRDVVALIRGCLEASGLAPERLVIEITESVTLFDAEATMAVVEQLDQLGVAIALDDFGTGYSSLSYLVRLRPRMIKIDRYFVNPSFSSEYNSKLLETIVSLGEKLDVMMLAEGIETKAHLEHLRSLGCTLGQGYFFSHAVPADDFQSLIDGLEGCLDWSDATSRRRAGQRADHGDAEVT